MVCCVVLAFVGWVWCDDLFPMQSSVSPLNDRNFAQQITKQRARDVNIIFFYQEVSKD